MITISTDYNVHNLEPLGEPSSLVHIIPRIFFWRPKNPFAPLQQNRTSSPYWENTPSGRWTSPVSSYDERCNWKVWLVELGYVGWWTTRNISYGCFLKWWYPPNTPKRSFLVGKAMVVGYHHFSKLPHVQGHRIYILLLTSNYKATNEVETITVHQT